MPSNDSYMYMTTFEHENCRCTLEPLRRPENMIHCTTDPWEIEVARKACVEGREVTLGGVHGFILSVKPAPVDYGRSSCAYPALGWRVTIHPTTPRAATSSAKDVCEDMLRRYYPLIDGREQICTKQEDSMKVFEGIVVKVNDQGEPTDVLSVVAPFVAKNAAEAGNVIRIDYAQTNHLTGKDAAALQVRVREFPVSL